MTSSATHGHISVNLSCKVRDCVGILQSIGRWLIVRTPLQLLAVESMRANAHKIAQQLVAGLE